MMATCTFALYPEQAGKYDWLKQNLGEVTIAKFNGDQIFVASKAGAIAALNSVDGSVAWRTLLDQGQEVISLDISNGITLAITSTNLLRAFSSQGQLLWETGLEDADGCSGQAGMGATTEVTEVIVACGPFVASYNAKSGKKAWSAYIGAHSGGASAVAVGSDGKATITTVSADGNAVHWAIILTADGTIESQNNVVGSGFKQSSRIAFEGAAVALTPSGKVCIGTAGARSFTCSSIKDFLPSGAAVDASAASLMSGSCSNTFVVQSGAAAGAVLKLENGSLKKVLAAEGSVALACDAAAAGNSGSVIAAKSTPSGVQIQLFDLTDGSLKQTITDGSLSTTTVNGAVLHVAAAFAGPSGQALVQLEEGSLAFYPTIQAESTNAWVRPEYLASVNDLLFAELPAPTPENEAQWLASQPSTSESLQIQLLALKAQVGLATPEELAAVEKYKALTSDRLRPTRDPDGFRRQLIIATNTGKVVALHSNDGRVLWSLEFGPLKAASKLAPWRTPHDLKHDALIVAFHTSAKELVATVINTHTGAIESTEQVPITSEVDIISLPTSLHEEQAGADQHIFAVMSGGSATVLPRTDAARAAFAEQAPHVVRWKVDSTAGTISGIGLTSTGEERTLWTVLAAPKATGLEILAVASKDQEESVYSAARPVPGGGIILKHLSPNTVLVIAGPGKDAKLSKSSSRVIATILDAATGKVLVSQEHAAAAGPVHAVVSENWAAYHFWSLDIERWQVAVLDGYHSAPPQLSVFDLALGRPAAYNATAAAASSDNLPTFERQVFTTRLPVSTLGVSKTAHGTAAKMLLIGTPGGQVYMMDRRYLDARRPIVQPGTKPTPQQAAEGLPPYQPELPVAGQLFATLDRRVARLKKVVTKPAVLESASLMVAVGLDTFYARLQPSRGFDMVPDDFPHALLVAMVAGMALALVLLRAVLQQRALKLKWQ